MHQLKPGRLHVPALHVNYHAALILTSTGEAECPLCGLVDLEKVGTEDYLSPFIHEEDLDNALHVNNLYGREDECVRVAHFHDA